MKLRTFLKATFGLTLFSSCVAIAGLLYYLSTDHNAFVTDKTIIIADSQPSTFNVDIPEMIISDDVDSGSDAGTSNQEEKKVVIVRSHNAKKIKHSHRELVCYKVHELAQGGGNVKLCEYVDVYDDTVQ